MTENFPLTLKEMWRRLFRSSRNVKLATSFSLSKKQNCMSI